MSIVLFPFWKKILYYTTKAIESGGEMDISSKLKELRGTKTLEYVSEKTGIPIVTLSRYENNQRTPKSEYLNRLSNFYQLDLNSYCFDDLNLYIKKTIELVKNSLLKDNTIPNEYVETIITILFDNLGLHLGVPLEILFRTKDDFDTYLYDDVEKAVHYVLDNNTREIALLTELQLSYSKATERYYGLHLNSYLSDINSSGITNDGLNINIANLIHKKHNELRELIELEINKLTAHKNATEQADDVK